jgi:hypothetical protein
VAADLVRRAASLLADARRPLVLAGAGAFGAAAGVERLAGRVGAALVTTIGGKGLFAGNPRSLGLAGSFADAATAAAFAAADVSAACELGCAASATAAESTHAFISFMRSASLTCSLLMESAREAVVSTRAFALGGATADVNCAAAGLAAQTRAATSVTMGESFTGLASICLGWSPRGIFGAVDQAPSRAGARY